MTPHADAVSAGRLSEAEAPAPLIVGLGGTTRVNSSSERALDIVLGEVKAQGARTLRFGAADLDLPMYAPERRERTEAAARLIEAIQAADGLVVATPGYHGGVSGLVKNALDYVEDLREDVRPYLDGRAVGCIVCASGHQATVTTLVSLRQVVHALRGWPTPLGVVIDSAESVWDADGALTSAKVDAQLRTLAHQVLEFARLRMRPMIVSRPGRGRRPQPSRGASAS